MRSQPFQAPRLAPEVSSEIDERWERAVTYFKNRGAVIFSSYCRFWEKHAFVQQSLAKALVLSGIEVIWLDGTGWRKYSPSIGIPSPLLKVKQLRQLPGRRVPWVAELNIRMQKQMLRALIRAKGGRPVLWIEGGIDERLAAGLPYIDVFSVFDDPYRHTPMGDLCRKAGLILTQNSYALRTLLSMHARKTRLAFPPVDLSPGVFDEQARLDPPPGFPDRIMGYIGSFFSTGFDLLLFENFITSFPEWGFLLMGRTDARGEEYLARFRRHPNFWHVPWNARSQTGAAWRLLDLSLLFYRPNRDQDGAFPTKVLESLHFGVPCIATQVPKTENLEGRFPRSPFADVLKGMVADAMAMGEEQLKAEYLHFAYEMNPRLHLARVAESLQMAE
jgi:glycosyltransferase involved in cell wall biosynthesis